MNNKKSFCAILLIVFGIQISCRSIKAYEQSNHPIFFSNDISNLQEFEQDELKIGTYNIAFGQEINAAINILISNEETSNLDVLFLQELDEIGTNQIAKALGLNYLYFPISYESKYQQNFGNAILCRSIMVDPLKIILPNKKSTNNRMRSATFASTVFNNQRLILCSTHIATISIGIQKQSEQIEYLVQQLSNLETQLVIAGGDFNTIVPDLELKLNQQFDTIGFTEMSAGIRQTVGAHFNVLKPTLDHIFAKGFDVYGQGKIEDDRASDHFPIWVSLGKG